MADKKEGSIMLQVYFNRALGVEYNHKMIVFHVNDTTEQALTKILGKAKISRVPDEFALYYLDKTISVAKPSKSPKKSKTSGSAVTWTRMAEGSNISAYGLLPKDKMEIRPKHVISFQFPDDTTKTIPCDYKMPINEMLQIVFEDEACKRFSGLYLYDGDTRLDTSVAFLEQGVRHNATVFFRHTDMAPQNKKRQANLTNYRLSTRMPSFKLMGGLDLQGTATETADFFIQQIKTNISTTALIKMHGVISELDIGKREAWMGSFIDLDGIDIIMSVVTQIDAGMIKLAADLDILFHCLKCLRLILSTQSGREQIKLRSKRYMRLLSDQLNSDNEEQKKLVLEMLSIICIGEANSSSSSNSSSSTSETLKTGNVSESDMIVVNARLATLGNTIQSICNQLSSSSPRPFIATTSTTIDLISFKERISAFDSTLKVVETCICELTGSKKASPKPIELKTPSSNSPSAESERIKEPLKLDVPVVVKPDEVLPATSSTQNTTDKALKSLSSNPPPANFISSPPPPRTPTPSFPITNNLPAYGSPNTNFAFGQSPVFGASGFIPSASLMGMPSPIVNTPTPSPVLASTPVIISIQDPTPTPLDPLAQKVLAVKTEANGIVNSIVNILHSLEAATETTVIVVAKSLKEFKPQITLLQPYIPRIVNTPFEPTPGKNKMEMLKDASKSAISDLLATFELVKQALDAATPTDAVQITKVLRGIKLPST